MSTKTELQAAREYAAQPERKCAAHALDIDYGFASHVTHAEKLVYVARNIAYAEAIEAGEHDTNFTVRQRMHYFLTGDCVPFLPPEK